jgi:hypothetical protein
LTPRFAEGRAAFAPRLPATVVRFFTPGPERAVVPDFRFFVRVLRCVFVCGIEIVE